MNSNPEILNLHAPDPAALPPPTAPADGRPGRTRHRRTGKVASLPKAARDLLNAALDDGLPYRQIIQNLGPQGGGLNENNISEWKDGGYQDYLQDKFWRDDMRARQETFLDLIAGSDPLKLPEAGLQLAATGACELLRDLCELASSPGAKLDPNQYVRVSNSLARLSRSILTLQQYRDAAAKSQELKLKQLAKNRELVEAERIALLDSADDLFGTKSYLRLQREALATPSAPLSGLPSAPPSDLPAHLPPHKPTFPLSQRERARVNVPRGPRSRQAPFPCRRFLLRENAPPQPKLHRSPLQSPRRLYQLSTLNHQLPYPPRPLRLYQLSTINHQLPPQKSTASPATSGCRRYSPTAAAAPIPASIAAPFSLRPPPPSSHPSNTAPSATSACPVSCQAASAHSPTVFTARSLYRRPAPLSRSCPNTVSIVAPVSPRPSPMASDPTLTANAAPACPRRFRPPSGSPNIVPTAASISRNRSSRAIAPPAPALSAIPLSRHSPSPAARSP